MHLLSIVLFLIAQWSSTTMQVEAAIGVDKIPMASFERRQLAFFVARYGEERGLSLFQNNRTNYLALAFEPPLNTGRAFSQALLVVEEEMGLSSSFLQTQNTEPQVNLSPRGIRCDIDLASGTGISHVFSGVAYRDSNCNALLDDGEEQALYNAGTVDRPRILVLTAAPGFFLQDVNYDSDVGDPPLPNANYLFRTEEYVAPSLLLRWRQGSLNVDQSQMPVQSPVSVLSLIGSLIPFSSLENSATSDARLPSTNVLDPLYDPCRAQTAALPLPPSSTLDRSLSMVYGPASTTGQEPNYCLSSIDPSSETVSGTVWFDRNQDSTLQVLETRLSNMILDLISWNVVDNEIDAPQIVESTTTDNEGNYKFDFQRETNKQYIVALRAVTSTEYTRLPFDCTFDPSNQKISPFSAVYELLGSPNREFISSNFFNQALTAVDQLPPLSTPYDVYAERARNALAILTTENILYVGFSLQIIEDLTSADSIFMGREPLSMFGLTCEGYTRIPDTTDFPANEAPRLTATCSDTREGGFVAGDIITTTFQIEAGPNDVDEFVARSSNGIWGNVEVRPLIDDNVQQFQRSGSAMEAPSFRQNTFKSTANSNLGASFLYMDPDDFSGAYLLKPITHEVRVTNEMCAAGFQFLDVVADITNFQSGFRFGPQRKCVYALAAEPCQQTVACSADHFTAIITLERDESDALTCTPNQQNRASIIIRVQAPLGCGTRPVVLRLEQGFREPPARITAFNFFPDDNENNQYSLLYSQADQVDQYQVVGFEIGSHVTDQEENIYDFAVEYEQAEDTIDLNLILETEDGSRLIEQTFTNPTPCSSTSAPTPAPPTPSPPPPPTPSPPPPPTPSPPPPPPVPTPPPPTPEPVPLCTAGSCAASEVCAPNGECVACEDYDLLGQPLISNDEGTCSYSCASQGATCPENFQCFTAQICLTIEKCSGVGDTSCPDQFYCKQLNTQGTEDFECSVCEPDALGCTFDDPNQGGGGGGAEGSNLSLSFSVTTIIVVSLIPVLALFLFCIVMFFF